MVAHENSPPAPSEHVQSGAILRSYGEGHSVSSALCRPAYKPLSGLGCDSAKAGTGARLSAGVVQRVLEQGSLPLGDDRYLPISVLGLRPVKVRSASSATTSGLFANSNSFQQADVARMKATRAALSARGSRVAVRPQGWPAPSSSPHTLGRSLPAGSLRCLLAKASSACTA